MIAANVGSFFAYFPVLANLLLLLHFLIESCSVFHSVCLFSCNVDVQFSRQRFGDRPGSLEIFSFPFFAVFAERLSCILFTCSSLDAGPSYDILNSVNIADSIC